MAVIGYNSAAVNAAYYLNQNTSALNSSIQELASGSRIADPANDAAGVAVSGQMTAAIAQLGAATQGAQDVISFAQTTDGFLSTIQQQLTRMSELAQEATNGAFGSADRANYSTDQRHHHRNHDCGSHGHRPAEHGDYFADRPSRDRERGHLQVQLLRAKHRHRIHEFAGREFLDPRRRCGHGEHGAREEQHSGSSEFLDAGAGECFTAVAPVHAPGPLSKACQHLIETGSFSGARFSFSG